MKATYFILFLILPLAMKTCDKNNMNNECPDKITPVEIARGVLHGNGGEGIEASELVITDPGEWQKLMNKMNSVNRVTDRFAETQIDFERYMVLAVFDSIRPNGNYRIQIKEIRECPGKIKALVEKSHYGRIATAVIVQPFHIVKIPKSEKPVEFTAYEKSK